MFAQLLFLSLSILKSHEAKDFFVCTTSNPLPPGEWTEWSPGNITCCFSSLITLDEGIQICNPYEVERVPGEWTEWSPIEGATCNDTCGMCGTVLSRRFCDPSGTFCSGPFESHQPCPTAPFCKYPRKTIPCCSNYVRRTENGLDGCYPPLPNTEL